MDCHQSTNGLHRLVNGLGSVAFGALLLTCAALPAAAQTAKLQRLNDAYKNDARLIVVSSKGPQTKRCVAAGVGHFAILTSYECLASWWTRKQDYSVNYASDPKREHFFGNFERAHRASTSSRWAILETAGHSNGYFGYEDLDRLNDLSRRTFEFIGFSKKVKDGRELAIQSPCRLSRTRAGLYTSECGGDFDATGILILHSGGDGRYVSGLATAQSQTKVGNQLLVTLAVTSRGDYGVELADLRRDQESRYKAIVGQRNALAAEHHAASAGHDWDAQAERARRAAQRQADLDKFTAAMGALGAALGGARQPVAPQTPRPPATPPERPVASPPPVAAFRKPSAGPTRWECGIQTTCVADARAELQPNGMAQLRLVDRQSNVLAYMNFYWSALGPINAINRRRLTVTVGIGSTSRCQLTSDAAFYLNGRIETFLGGVGTGPEIASMEYRTVKREFYIPDGGTLTIGPGAAYCAGAW